MKTVAISTLTLGKRGVATAVTTGTIFPSVVAAGGTRTSTPISVLTLGRRANVIPIVRDLLTVVISGSNCPPAPQVPQSGQRYPGFYIL